jgi:hypothetical protein
VAPPRRRGHPDRRLRQPTGDVARRVAALRRAPGRRGRAHARPSRARRPGPARRDAAGPVRRPPTARAAARTRGDRSATRVRPSLRGAATSPSRAASRKRCSTTISTCRMCTRVAGSYACSTGATRRSRTHSLHSSSRTGSSRRSPSFRPEIHGSRGCATPIWNPGVTDSRARSRSRSASACFAHAIAWLRQRDHLPPKDRPDFDTVFHNVLGRAADRIKG